MLLNPEQLAAQQIGAQVPAPGWKIRTVSALTWTGNIFPERTL
jgi:hypothetical protein